MTIDHDKDKDRTGSSGKSPTKFKERPSQPKPHPENIQGGESPMRDKSAIEREQEEEIDGGASEEVREKVRRSIPKPGHPGKKPASGGEPRPRQGDSKDAGSGESNP